MRIVKNMSWTTEMLDNASGGNCYFELSNQLAATILSMTYIQVCMRSQDQGEHSKLPPAISPALVPLVLFAYMSAA